MKREKGFALLLELMVAVAVLAIVAAIAAPNMVRMAQVQNQNAAVGLLRRVAQAEGQYVINYPHEGYVSPYLLANGFDHVGSIHAQNCQFPNLLDAVSASAMSGNFEGYSYDFEVPQGQAPSATCPGMFVAAAYYVTAVPVGSTTTGNCLGGAYAFYIDQTGVVRYAPCGQRPTSLSPAWGE